MVVDFAVLDIAYNISFEDGNSYRVHDINFVTRLWSTQDVFHTIGNSNVFMIKLNSCNKEHRAFRKVF